MILTELIIFIINYCEYKNVNILGIWMRFNEMLLSVDEIGDKIADSIINYFSIQVNKDLVTRLIAYGLQFTVSDIEKKSNKLDNLNFVISGTFVKYSRNEIKNMIELNGGKNLSALSQKTNYLIAGDNFGVKKKEKAISFNIPVISESDLETMLK